MTSSHRSSSRAQPRQDEMVATESRMSKSSKSFDRLSCIGKRSTAEPSVVHCGALKVSSLGDLTLSFALRPACWWGGEKTKAGKLDKKIAGRRPLLMYFFLATHSLLHHRKISKISSYLFIHVLLRIRVLVRESTASLSF